MGNSPPDYTATRHTRLASTLRAADISPHAMSEMVSVDGTACGFGNACGGGGDSGGSDSDASYYKQNY